jgi:hypothetical protein
MRNHKFRQTLAANQNDPLRQFFNILKSPATKLTGGDENPFVRVLSC